jgi:WD40 repeat protein
VYLFSEVDMTETNELTGNSRWRAAVVIGVAALGAGCGDLVNPGGATAVAYAPQGDVATFVSQSLLMYDGKLEHKKASMSLGFQSNSRDQGEFRAQRTLSGNGQVAAAASDHTDGFTQRVAAFRVPGGERLMSMQTQLLRELLLSRDGDLLAVLGAEGGMPIYDPNGREAGFGGYRGVVEMYSTDGGALLWRVPTNTRAPGSFVFSADGTRFYGHVVRVPTMGRQEVTMTGWDARTGQVLFSGPNSMGTSHNLVLWPDGGSVMAATVLGENEAGEGVYGFTWWSTEDGRVIRTLPQAPGFSNPNLVAVSPEGSFFASHANVTGPDTVRLLSRRLQVWRSDGSFLHAFETESVSMAFSPDGAQIATLNHDGSVSIYRTIDGTRLAHRMFTGSVF